MCAGALWLAAASRWPVRGLPLLFLWAFPKATLDTHGPRPQTLLGSRQACPGLSVAVRSLPLLFTHGPRPQTFLQAAAWPTKLLLWASEGNAASLWPVRSLPLLFTHGPRPQTFLQAAAWPTKLFLWASEGNVRHPRARPSNPPRQPAGLPRPLCGLSEACLFSSPTGPARKRFCRPQLGPESFFYGLPKATLDEACLFSSPTGPARKRFCRPAALQAHKAWPSMGFRRQRPQTFLQAAAWPRKLFLWASEACPKLDTHGPRPQTFLGSRQACFRRPRPLCGLSEACLFSSPTGPARKRSCRPQLGPESFFYGLPKATLDTHGPRPQTLLGSRQACRGLSVACPKPASSLHPRAPPANVSAGRSLAQKAFSMGFRRQR